MKTPELDPFGNPIRPVRNNLTGQTFGRLIVIERGFKEGKRGTYWRCLCSCGNETVVIASDLLKGTTKSCGCIRNEIAGARLRTHGHSNNPETARAYRIWKAMKTRCYNPSTLDYPYYGGRGITVCDRWKSSFPAFLEDMGVPSAEETLDRVDPDGNYEPTNCRWATRQEQTLNRRRTIRVEWNGITKTLRQWVDEYGKSYDLVYERMFVYGWSVAEALTLPIDRGRTRESYKTKEEV